MSILQRETRVVEILQYALNDEQLLSIEFLADLVSVDASDNVDEVDEPVRIGIYRGRYVPVYTVEQLMNQLFIKRNWPVLFESDQKLQDTEDTEGGVETSDLDMFADGGDERGASDDLLVGIRGAGGMGR